MSDDLRIVLLLFLGIGWLIRADLSIGNKILCLFSLIKYPPYKGSRWSFLLVWEGSISHPKKREKALYRLGECLESWQCYYCSEHQLGLCDCRGCEHQLELCDCWVSARDTQVAPAEIQVWCRIWLLTSWLSTLAACWCAGSSCGLRGMLELLPLQFPNTSVHFSSGNTFQNFKFIAGRQKVPSYSSLFHFFFPSSLSGRSCGPCRVQGFDMYSASSAKLI